jgi:hypothetical protein
MGRSTHIGKYFLKSTRHYEMPSSLLIMENYLMANSFMQNHQSALDSQREDDAIQYLEDCGVYPDPDDKYYPMETD